MENIEQQGKEWLENMVWEFVKPAPKSNEPENSDGYDESDVYQTVKAVIEKCAQLWAKKADKWDKLEAKIDRCYTNEDGSENEDEDMDLCVIGEYAAVAFGYL